MNGMCPHCYGPVAGRDYSKSWCFWCGISVKSEEVDPLLRLIFESRKGQDGSDQGS